MNTKKCLALIVALYIGHCCAQTQGKEISAPAAAPANTAPNPSTDVFHLSANPPRALEHALATLHSKYGWTISYEDPQYLDAKELTESTGPKAIDDSPSKPTLVPGGKPFSVDIPAAKPPADAPPEEESLKLVVDAYNRSGNPGEFELRQIAEGSFAVVGVNDRHAASPQKPLLDTAITVPAEKRTIDETLEIICRKLTEQTHIPVSLGITPRSLLEHTTVSAGGTNVAARVLLPEALAGATRKTYWQLLFDPRSKGYVLNIHGISPAKTPAREGPGKPPPPISHP